MECYKVVSSFLRDRGRHGDTAIYRKESVISTERQDYNILNISHIIEYFAAQLYDENCEILIIYIYRPNTQPADVEHFLDCMRTILECCLSESSENILMEDFNFAI